MSTSMRSAGVYTICLCNEVQLLCCSDRSSTSAMLCLDDLLKSSAGSCRACLPICALMPSWHGCACQDHVAGVLEHAFHVGHLCSCNILQHVAESLDLVNIAYIIRVSSVGFTRRLTPQCSPCLQACLAPASPEALRIRLLPPRTTAPHLPLRHRTRVCAQLTSPPSHHTPHHTQQHCTASQASPWLCCV